jgi:uncharacterized membrane protein YbhN (UPF0104 family)
MRAWGWVRLLAGAAILAALVWRLGAGPFLDGLRRVDVRSVAVAVALNVVATLCCAWRWRLVARGLGAELAGATAIAAYYRSQFLNTTLPGGVLGDVHRGVRHGRDVDDVGRGLRAVFWERAAGQAVQVALALLVLAALPSPMRSTLPLLLTAVAAVGAIVLAVRVVLRRRPGPWLRRMRADVQAGLLAPRSWPGVFAASAVVVAAHTATFILAARTAGVDASVSRLVPLGLVALLAASVPANVGGWGPREGVAAWAFAAAGLGAAQGVAAATVYGVLVFAASLPGVGVLLAPRLASPPAAAPVVRVPVRAGGGGG